MGFFIFLLSDKFQIERRNRPQTPIVRYEKSSCGIKGVGQYGISNGVFSVNFAGRGAASEECTNGANIIQVRLDMSYFIDRITVPSKYREWKRRILLQPTANTEIALLKSFTHCRIIAKAKIPFLSMN
jgi:hypothetical protein